MKDRYKVIAMTPAGRRRYLSILLRYLLSNRHVIDEWHLWENTTDELDRCYLRTLVEEYPDFVRIVPSPGRIKGIKSIYRFFEHCQDADTIYVRFDDDICFVELDAVEQLLEFRIAHPDYFLVFPNLINNALTSHLHQRFGLISSEFGVCKYDCMDEVGWKTPAYAEHVHKIFLEKVTAGSDLDSYRFSRWELNHFERFSINCFAFFGHDFASFGGHVGRDDERWLTQIKPAELGRPNCIYGHPIMAHFAFYTQRRHLDKSGILARYKELISK